MPIAAAYANDRKFGYIYRRTKRVEGNPAIMLFGGQVDSSGNLTVKIPDVKGYTIDAPASHGGWFIRYTKNGTTFTYNWQDWRLLLEEQTVTTYENVPADALNASKLVSQVVTKSEPWAKFPEFMAAFDQSTWFAVSIQNPRYITERTTTRYKYREIFRDDIIVAKGVKLYEIDTIEEFTERVYLRKEQVGGLQPYTRYTPELVPFEYTKTTYKKECLTRWQERKETSINKGQNTKSSGYLFQQKTEVRDVYSIPEIQYRPPAYPVTQKPLLAKVQTGRAGVSNFVQSRDFQSASTLTTTAELSAYAKWLGETRWQRYYSRELACGYTSTLGYQPFQGVLAGNGLFIRDRFGISLNNEGDSWQFVEDCIGNKIGTIPEVAAPPIAYPPLLISTLNIAAIATQNLTVGIPITPIQLAIAGGTAPYTFSSATLPLGLSISGAQIVGTPLAIATTSVTVTVTDSLLATDSTTFNIAVVAAPVPVAIINETYTVDISVALEVTVSLSIGIPVPFEVDINVDVSVTVTMVLMKILVSEVPLGAIASDTRLMRLSLLNSEVPLGAIASNATVQRVIDLTSEVPLGAIASEAVVGTNTSPVWETIGQDEWRGIGQNQWRDTQ